MNADGVPRVLRGHQRTEVAHQLATRFVRAPGTMRELAEEFDCRPSLVRRLLEEAGLQADGAACVGVPREELAAVLAARYRAGASIEAIAADTGLGWPVVRDLLAQAGVTVRPRNSVPQELADRVITAYRSGATLRALAEFTGCSYSTIRRFLLAAGVTLRPPGTRPNPE